MWENYGGGAKVHQFGYSGQQSVLQVDCILITATPEIASAHTLNPMVYALNAIFLVEKIILGIGYYRYMSTDSQRELLENLKRRLLEDMERGAAASETVELEQNKVGRLSRMDAMQQQEMQKAAQLLIRRRLLNIERAMSALAKDEYGFCELCGEQIPERRLQVKPEALSCVNCQQKSESNQ